ncbi:MAG TPA: DUF1080 domain-containing protein [Bacteroidales bacterium]|jgi:hypothetical protein|nr:DUF1080 domain-containing protein [Bacteroidales bacterium]
MTEQISVRKLIILLSGAILFISCRKEEKWTNLIDKSLSNWDNYLSYRHRSGYNGSVPKDTNGIEIAPIGYNKPGYDVFSVIEENNEPVIRISGEIYGCLISKEEYSNYHLKLKVKWGEKKWDPRKQLLKDSGILYHSIGPIGEDYWRSWMLSQEFQIMEGHMGDFWSQKMSAIDIRAYIPESVMNAAADETRPFIPFGYKGKAGFCMRSANYEIPDSWNDIDLICFNGKSLHIVNGHVVMILQNSRHFENGGFLPLVKGKIQIQSEAAEVFYKDIKIRKLDKFPEKYEKYFRQL